MNLRGGTRADVVDVGWEDVSALFTVFKIVWVPFLRDLVVHNKCITFLERDLVFGFDRKVQLPVFTNLRHTTM